MQPSERVAAGLVIDVGVDLQRGADPGVAEDGLRVAGWNAQLLQERGDCVPEVVDLDRPKLVGVADATERPDEVARLNWPTGPSCEHQVCLWPR